MSLLPPNSTALERALEQVVARLGDVAVPLRTIWNADTCPVELLPWLAWSLSIDTWDASWPEEVRRARVRAAIAIQRSKGTVQSVRDIVAVFGGAIELREWWQLTPAGEPHTFALVLNLTGATGAAPTSLYLDQVIDEIGRTKPARSHFTFSLSVDAAAAIGVTAVGRPVTYARLDLTAPAA